MAAPWTVKDVGDQTGRTVVVTGANSGLGLRTAEALAAAGARVLLACRDAKRGGAALDTVAGGATGAAPELVTLDLASLASVRAAAADVDSRVDALDVLVNNAGIMAVPEGRTADGFERQLGTNHLGHFALTGLLLGALRRAEAPRVVTVTSIAHRMGRIRFDDLDFDGRYQRWLAYGQSKLANALFAYELQRRSDAAGIGLAALLAHPGYAATHLQAAAPEESGNRVMLASAELTNRLFAQSDADGALPQLRAATDPAARGGEVYGPGRWLGLRGPPVRTTLAAAARDPEVARRLWAVSEARTGVSFDFS